VQRVDAVPRAFDPDGRVILQILDEEPSDGVVILDDQHAVGHTARKA